MKLLYKLTLIMLFISTVPLAISGYSSINISQEEVVGKIQQLQLKSAANINSQVKKYLNDIITNLRFGVEYLKLESLSDRAKRGSLKILYRQFDQISIISLLNSSGKEIIDSVYTRRGKDSRKEGDRSVSPGELKEFRRHMPFKAALSQGIAMGPVYTSKQREVPLVPLAIAFDIHGGKSKWVLGVELSLAKIQEMIAGFSLGKRGIAYLVDGEGRLIFHPSRERALSREDVSGVSIVRRFLQQRDSGVMSFVDKDGTVSIGAYGPVGFQDWAVVVQQPQEEALVGIRKMRERIFFWIGVSLVIAVGIGIVFARGVSEPVKKCAQGALEIAKGKFDHKIKVESKDEIGQLAQTFNYMSGELKGSRRQIEKQNEEIRRWNLELQDRVEERTRELKEAHERLLRTQKMAAVGALGAGAAHELNNPLVGVLGFVQLLLMKKKEGDPDYRALRSIEEQSKRCKEIVHGLLAFSQSQQEDRNYISLNLNSVINSALSLTKSEIVSQKISVNNQLDPELPDIYGDFNQLQQAFLNIISNARNAMPEGGVLSITTESDDHKTVRLKISDTGRGISQEIIQRIFDPFFTTKDNWQGTGLGLAVTNRIIDEHMGTIDVESELGKGATFILSFSLEDNQKLTGEHYKVEHEAVKAHLI